MALGIIQPWQSDKAGNNSYFVVWFLKKKREIVVVLLRHFKQTQDFTSFPRQAIVAHQSKLNSYFRALQYRSLLGADY